MYIKQLVVQNIKSFREATTFNFTPSLNFLVGNNNCGKSTIFEAITFIAGAKYDPQRLFSSGTSESNRVEIILAGPHLRARIETEQFSKLVDYLHADSDGDEVLRIERSSEVRQVQQSGRTPNTLDVKKICFWHPERAQFENPTGIDALFKALIDFEAVWADVAPVDTADFGATKTLGRLFASATAPFYTTDVWRKFTEAHGAAFGATEDSMAGQAQSLADELGSLVREQYGPAGARFEFQLPEPAAFVKSGSLQVDDNGIETPLSDKGTGMQRAFALAIIQLWARFSAQESDGQKPLILLLDEPETWLHPVAQRRLADALATIAESQQVFVVTHSPYLLQRFVGGEHELIAFGSRGESPRVSRSRDLGVGRGRNPSLGAITYRAFGICSEEFHDELYGIIAAHLSGPDGTAEAKEREIDELLVSKGLVASYTWKRANGNSWQRTLPVYIRNTIHHPENRENVPFTHEQLEESTAALLSIVSSLALVAS